MRKIQILQQLMADGVVAVLRGSSSDEVVNMASYAIKGGLNFIEVTMTVPGALDVIKELSSRNNREHTNVVIGAGTVLDPETARLAILSGADFIVSPSLNHETIKLCNRYRIAVMPGVMTIREAQEALELGVDIVKLFPGSHFSPSFIKAFQGPLPHVNIMPTGGVTLQNIKEWINAGACAVGIGSDLTSEAVKTGNYKSITDKATLYVEAYQEARNSMGN